MNDKIIPADLAVPLAALADLAVEYSRLDSWVATAQRVPNSGAVRHALRKMADFLNSCDVSVESLDGRPFDAGMAVRVVDTVDDPDLIDGESVIIETVSPLVLWRGQVVKNADVVTRKGTRKS